MKESQIPWLTPERKKKSDTFIYETINFQDADDEVPSSASLNLWMSLQIKKLMLDYAFRHIDKVYFDIGEENFRSRKATEKLGAVMHKKNSNGKLIYLLFKQDYVL